jgi:hypothetical protein
VSHAKTNKTVKSTGALHFAGLFTAPVRTRCGSSVVEWTDSECSSSLRKKANKMAGITESSAEYRVMERL